MDPSFTRIYISGIIENSALNNYVSITNMNINTGVISYILGYNQGTSTFGMYSFNKISYAQST